MNDIGNSFQDEECVEHSTWFLGKNKICEILLGKDTSPLKFKSSPSEKNDGFGKKTIHPEKRVLVAFQANIAAAEVQSLGVTGVVSVLLVCWFGKLET